MSDSLAVRPSLWRPRRKDRWPLVAIALLPLLVALPQLLGVLKVDPMLYLGDGPGGAWMVERPRAGYLSGLPYIDPSSGYYTQALGRLAVDQWLRGIVPWWNSFSGIGMPLAGQYNPAAFSALTMLLLLPNGMAWRHLALQILAGWGCYGLLRQIGVARVASLTGGLLFAQNGALAWFNHTPPDPAAFLPWVLLGIERAVTRAQLKEPHGWRLLAIATCMVLLAGFPETAYICGLLALVWSALRWLQCPPACRSGAAWRLLLGCGVGVALAAPQVLPFLEFLSSAYVGIHTGAVAHASLAPLAAVPSLLAPYAYGPIFAYPWPPLYAMWAIIGGYADIIELALAAYGLCHRRDPLSWMLCAWIVLAIAKTFGVPPLAEWWNLVPGMSITAFFRYSQPTWELAIFILAAFGVDALGRAGSQRRDPVLAAGAVLVAGIGLLLANGARQWPHEPFAALHTWMLASAAWAIITSVFVACLLVWGSPCRRRSQAIAALLALDATVMFAIPTLSNPRGGTIDATAIGFLQRNLGLGRFYTLGPIAPNYGAYFGIASINHNYIPVPKLWVDWVIAHLDRGADPYCFTGNFTRDPRQPSPAEELRGNLAAYEEVGVKYVVTGAGDNPFSETISPPTLDRGNRPLVLTAGQNVQGEIPPSVLVSDFQINEIGVLVANFNNTADGWLNVTLCTSGQCARGAADLAGSHDNQIFWVPLSQPITVAAHSAVTYTIVHQSSTKPVALWAYPTAVSQSLSGPEGPISDFGLKLQLRERQAILAEHVYGDELMNIYQLPAPKPYFETPGSSCLLQPQSRTSLIADCAMAALLVRRELFFPGWEASYNGKPTPIDQYDGLFQSINLPAGHSTVAYRYAPTHIEWAWLLMGLATFVLVIPSLVRIKRLDCC